MSKIEVNKIGPQCGTTLTVGCGAGQTVAVDANTVTIGRCGGTVALASGASQTGFGREGSVDWQTGSIKTAATFTAASGEGYFVDTSSNAITANLPAGSAGAIVAFSDYARNFATNPLTISPNGSEKIGGVAGNSELTINGQGLTLVYVDSTKGWINVQNAEDTETGVLPAYIAATGGTVTTVCTNFKVHTFTGPGTFEITAGALSLSKLDYLVIAGGGGGGRGSSHGAGGGAGGYRESHADPVSGPYTASPLATPTSLGPFSAPISFPITVGAGGATQSGAAVGNQGSDTTFSSITSAGGGGGGRHPSTAGLAGGSGGGGGCAAGGAGNTPPVSPSQGNPGGTGGNGGHMAGGGGATAAGVSTPGTGAGGAGATTSINATPTTRAGGGGGGSNGSYGPSPGGSGGGGAGANNPSAGGNGTANTGSGGGGDGTSSTGGAGGSGLVIIRYRFQA
jgi:hypothetical protein